jgi:hypothetical protein
LHTCIAGKPTRKVTYLTVFKQCPKRKVEHPGLKREPAILAAKISRKLRKVSLWLENAGFFSQEQDLSREMQNKKQ